MLKVFGRRGRIAVLALLLAFASAALVGCEDVPADASKAAFCQAGERFSALQDVPFSEGQAAIKALAEVGTPTDIDKPAREGFVELVARMEDSDDAAEFLRKSQSLSAAESEHRTALTVYIQLTCLLANASTADFCVAGKEFAANRNGAFEDRKAALEALVKVGAPPDISPAARLGLIELVDRMNSATSNEQLDELTRTTSPDEREHLVALDAFIKRACT
ncbi:MAG: hypothetical protein NTV23_07980 [Propionibacteriales bacterium]|nr:hypothetical protein [Propionibacteriales bacterium]